MDVKTIFRKRIRELRKSKGLSMRAFAEALGVKKGRVNMWENSDTYPRIDMFIKLSAFFNVSIDYLVGNEGFSNERN